MPKENLSINIFEEEEHQPAVAKVEEILALVKEMLALIGKIFPRLRPLLIFIAGVITNAIQQIFNIKFPTTAEGLLDPEFEGLNALGNIYGAAAFAFMLYLIVFSLEKTAEKRGLPEENIKNFKFLSAGQAASAIPTQSFITFFVFNIVLTLMQIFLANIKSNLSKIAFEFVTLLGYGAVALFSISLFAGLGKLMKLPNFPSLIIQLSLAFLAIPYGIILAARLSENSASDLETKTIFTLVPPAMGGLAATAYPVAGAVTHGVKSMVGGMHNFYRRHRYVNEERRPINTPQEEKEKNTSCCIL